MFVAIAAVFMDECVKADDGYSVFTSVVTDSIFPNSESIRSPFKIVCYLSVFYETESHSILRILFVQGLHQGTDFPFSDIVHSVSSYKYPCTLIWFLMETLRISR